MLLPINRREMDLRHWHYLDFLLISGDAYVDHSSFGPAIISRYLESLGYRIGILPQPDWENPQAFLAMGRPRLGVLISGGNMDSLLNHYTAAKKPRKKDDYSPGGKRVRPDYAVSVYGSKAREAFGEDMPIIIGGIEASLRRFAHYDYWQDRVLPSVLTASKGDILVYGMGELAIGEIAAALAGGKGVKDCRHIPGIAYIAGGEEEIMGETLLLPSFSQVKENKQDFARAFAISEREQNFHDGKNLAQEQMPGEYVVVNRPMRPLTTKELDAIYELPYERRWHPSYDAQGGVPAFDELRFSLLSHRGCFGGCSFCALNFHQGRIIQSRSAKSVLREGELLTKLPDFKGYINDVGGPSANFRGQLCKKAALKGPCRDKQCLYPKICASLPLDSSEYEKLLTDLRRLPGVKKVFVRSGLRFDYAMAEKSRSFLHTLCRYHISGQLKIAPEHMAPGVLNAMGKMNPKIYLDFVKEYEKINKIQGKKQYLVPYFMSSHPGCRLSDALILAEYMQKSGCQPQQVQDFIPTPGTASTCMYYTGIDPRNMEPIYVPKSQEEKAMQRALLQFNKDEYKDLAKKAFTLAVKERDLLKAKDKPKKNKPKIKSPASKPQRIKAGGKKSKGRVK